MPIPASRNGRFWFPYRAVDGIETAQTLVVAHQDQYAWDTYNIEPDQNTGTGQGDDEGNDGGDTGGAGGDGA